MKRLGLRTLWKAVTVGQTAGAAAGACGSRSGPARADLALGAATSPPGPSEGRQNGGGVSDGEKTGATLLFSGIFLGLVGMTFTAMGWVNYEQSQALEWTQFLGPVLLSVGATFVLISVFKFHMLACVAGGRGGGGRAEGGEMAGGQSFVFTGINQPITFHRATVVQYIPPPYASVTQETSVPSGQPQPPQYHSVCPLGRPDMGANATLGPSAPASRRGSRNPEQRGEEEEEGKRDEDALGCLSPPAYEDLYPSPAAANHT